MVLFALGNDHTIEVKLDMEEQDQFCHASLLSIAIDQKYILWAIAHRPSPHSIRKVIQQWTSFVMHNSPKIDERN